MEDDNIDIKYLITLVSGLADFRRPNEHRQGRLSKVLHGAREPRPPRGPEARGLHSSTSQLYVSTFCGLHTSTFRFVVSNVCGLGCVYNSLKRLRLSWEVDASCDFNDRNWLSLSRDVDECKPLPEAASVLNCNLPWVRRGRVYLRAVARHRRPARAVRLPACSRAS